LPPALEHPDPGNTLYLEIEDVVSVVAPEDIQNIFKELRERLAALKGSRGESGKKVLSALDRTEELFQHLIKVREQLLQATEEASPR
jgi:hypothetical protein